MLGVLCAVLAPLVSTCGLFIWADRWRRSAIELNAYKGTLATPLFAASALLLSHVAPSEYGAAEVWWLIVSSFIGIVVADSLWLVALQRIGARRMIFIDATKPFLAVAAGYVFLDERSPANSWLVAAGVVVMVCGVLLVALEQAAEPPPAPPPPPLKPDNGVVDACKGVALQIDGPSPPRTAADGAAAAHDHVGYACALLNVVLDVYASVLTKKHASRLSTWDINLVRFGFGGGTMLVLAALGRATGALPAAPAHGPMSNGDYKAVAGGVVFVTFLCPAASTYALLHLDLAVAITLGSLGPLYALPVGRYLKREAEAVSGRALVGAALAIGATVVLGFSA